MKKVIDCYVEVVGEASDEDDDGVQGFYLVELRLTRPVDIEKLTPAEQSEIAEAVLDDFHDHQGIECLDDFSISVFLPNGDEVTQEDGLTGTSLVAGASHCGQVNDSDLPFDPEDEPEVGESQAR